MTRRVVVSRFDRDDRPFDVLSFRVFDEAAFLTPTLDLAACVDGADAISRCRVDFFSVVVGCGVFLDEIFADVSSTFCDDVLVRLVDFDGDGGSDFFFELFALSFDTVFFLVFDLSV